MTDASEVHLFSWVEENLPWIGAIAAAFAVLVLFWYRTVISKFYTREAVRVLVADSAQQVKIAVEKDTDRIVVEVRKLSDRIDRKEELNSKEHGDIRHDLTMMHKKG